jgi:hypothetical protein
LSLKADPLLSFGLPHAKRANRYSGLFAGGCQLPGKLHAL